MNRPAQGLFIIGNDTEVGKTQITAGICHHLMHKGWSIAPRKPVISGYSLTHPDQADDAILSAAVDHIVSAADITAFRYQAALAPHLAARMEGQSLALSTLKKAIVNQLPKDALCIIEGAGGFYSPIAEQGLCSDLAHYAQLPIILVVENRLGCINQTLMSIKSIQQEGLILHSIILNQCQNTASKPDDCIEAIQQYAQIKPFNMPYLTDIPRWVAISEQLETQGWQL